MNENQQSLPELFEIANSPAPDALDRIPPFLTGDMLYSRPITARQASRVPGRLTRFNRTS